MNNYQLQQRLSLFLRCLFALVYDSLLIICLFFPITAIILFFYHGNAISANSLWYQLLLGITIYLWCGFCWTHHGQTLGAKCWRLRVTDINCNNLNWPQTAARFLTACLTILPAGLGWWWIFCSRRGQTLYDDLLKTKIIIVNKKF